MITRRQVLGVAGGMGVALATPLVGLGADERSFPRPDPALFQSGDLVWPKKPGAYVPYNAGPERLLSADLEQWKADRTRYLDHLAHGASLSPVDEARIDLLSKMDFRDFLAVYEGDQKPGIPGAYSGGGLYVGHVGILEIDESSKPWVIEAVLHDGVRRISYADWVRARTDQVVWLGRLRDLPAVDRARIPTEARKYLGQPYDFWNFDLDDDAGFYCSKLVWLSIFRSLGFPVDGGKNPRRALWFSPKQLLNVPLMLRIHDPGPYAY